MFDLIVRSATVVDPERRTQRVEDVAIENGRIALVEPVIAGAAREELPAEGLVLQPGVIDTHLHLTASLSSHAMAVRAGVTTAVDMAKMAAYGMKKFPEFRRIVGLTSYDVQYLDGRTPKHVTTTNRFLTSGYKGADGIKTGFTNAAGDCLVASATRNGRTLLVVLFNDDNRWEDAPAILDYGFRRLQTGK